ncbi:MAG TPA: type II CAAX endopeptidase family protein [Terriglobia bacterium]|nr:type II CAAX endopeptidase family protein [Terriglobia bacterium]
MTDPSRPSWVRRLFRNATEIRAGWRLLLFVALSFVFIRRVLWILLRLHLPDWPFLDPVQLFSDDLSVLLPILAATLIMGRLERRRLTGYGIPVRDAFGRRFWAGTTWGFGATLLLLGLIALGGGHKIAGVALERRGLAHYLGLWLTAAVMIGFTEEIAFRGYLLRTLSDGIRFWPAAVLLSAGFGALHYFTKPYERWEDFACTGLIGLLACLALRRTGSLAFPIGFHFAFDFGAIFVYSGRNAGEFAVGHLLETKWPGPEWLTGGQLGPEASWMVFVVIAVLFLAFDRTHREARFTLV